MKKMVYSVTIVTLLVLAVYVTASIIMIAQSDKQTEVDFGMQLGSVLARGVMLTMGVPLLVSTLSMISLVYTVKHHTIHRIPVTIVRILLIIASLLIAAISVCISLYYIGMNFFIPDLFYRINYSMIPVLVILWIAHLSLLRDKRGR